jgi:uncharacterized membrane protein YuzA (DUF378 family)
MSDRKAYLWMATGPAALVAVAIVVLLISSTTPARAVAFALLGIAGVIAVSLVFFAVGQSVDAERAAERKPPRQPEKPPRPERPPEKHPPHDHDHDRPALSRRRPRPPRRPS